MNKIISKIIGDPIFLRSIITAPDSCHGSDHWERVEKLGHMIAEKNGADKNVISLFAYLHDARRENDDDDPGHGERAVILLDEILAEGFVEVTAKQYQQLSEALSLHNRDDASSNDISVQTCWDADRLDLWRCGFIPNPDLMFTDFGKSPEMISYARTLNNFLDTLI